MTRFLRILIPFILAAGLAQGSTVDKSLFKPHVGLSLGAGIPDGSHKAGAEYTVSAGSRFYMNVPVLLGVEFSTAQYGGEADADDIRRANFFFKSVYQFRSYRFKDLYAGLAIGPTWERKGLTDGVFFAFAPHAGAEFPLRKTLSNDVSLGAELRYLISTSDFPDALSIGGVLKYWF